jgi:hypothetical protein
MRCALCDNCGWVCENHPHKPSYGNHACPCGGAGMPCPWCNTPTGGKPPRVPVGMVIQFDKKGWRH